jgi:ATP-dependent exoDNAse (exonuclease V) beta subunit
VEQFINMPLPYPENLSTTQLERYNLLKMHHKGVGLDTNYRSLPEIVNWNNAFYRHLSDLLSPGHATLYDKLNQLPRVGIEGGFVSVRFLGDDAIKAEEFMVLQGEEVLRLVRELIDEKNYAPSDIAILTRKNDHGSFLANLLLEHQIPVVSGESLLVKGKPEVQFLLAWLRVLSNMDVKVNLLHVCGYLLQHEKIPFKTLEELLSNVKMEENAVIKMLEKSGFEINAATLKAQNLAESVHNLCRVFEFDINDDSFLQFFLEAVWFSGDQTNPDIPTFLDKWTDIEKKYSVVLPQNADAVKIMSVHKSKGLEFPVVILAFAANEEGYRPEYLWIDDSAILPEGLPAIRFKILKDLNKTKLKPYIDEENSRKALDKINLLYVASTRPEAALYILSRNKKLTDAKDWGNFLKGYCANFQAIEENLWTWGDASHHKTKSEQKTKETPKPQHSKSYTIGNWRDKLEIARSRNAFFENEAIRMGNLVHTTLSWIRKTSDFDAAMLRLRTSGLASEADIIQVNNRISLLFIHEKIKPLFDSFDKAYIERNLLLSDGSTLRPDRVVVHGNTTTLVEYKSGGKNPKHVQQTTQYLEILRSMQIDIVFKGLLVYLSNPVEIIEVD